MIPVGNKENCYIAYSKIVELAGIIYRLFNNELSDIALEEIYEETFLEQLRRDYILVGEILMAHTGFGMEMLEFLTECMAFDDIDTYRDYVQSLEREDFLYKFYDKPREKESFMEALEKEDYKGLYEELKDIKSFTAFKMFLTKPEDFIKEYFELMQALCTKSFEETYKQLSLEGKPIEELVERLLKEEGTALEASEKLMGKKFYFKGPYEKYVYVPTKYIAFRMSRFNKDKHQILLINIRSKPYTSQDMVKLMKAMGDESRFKILELLSRGTPMMGKELAELLGVSTPTLSHHMEQLKEVGLINEERNKNFKYYTLNPRNMEKYLSAMEKQFLNNN